MKYLVMHLLAMLLISTVAKAEPENAVDQVENWGNLIGEPSVTILRDDEGRAVFVEYLRVGELGIVEGDMVLETHLNLQRSLASGVSLLSSELPAALTRFPSLAEQLRNSPTVPFGYGLRNLSQLWPQRTIPYKISAALGPNNNPLDFSPSQKKDVLDAITSWNNTGLIKLVPLDVISVEQAAKIGSYILIIPEANSEVCQSNVGRRLSEPTTMNLGMHCTKAAIIHEIGHALGLKHEQIRPDRKLYMDLDTSNLTDLAIRAVNECNWIDPKTPCAHKYKPLGDYDVCSIMHYRLTINKTNRWLKDVTKSNVVFILTKQGQEGLATCSAQFAETKCKQVGQRCGISVGDRKAISELYKSIPLELP